MNPTFNFACYSNDIEESNRHSVKFQLNFTANPPQGRLKLSGLEDSVIFNNSCAINDIVVKCFVLLNNVTIKDVVTAIYEQTASVNTTLGLLNNVTINDVFTTSYEETASVNTTFELLNDVTGVEVVTAVYERKVPDGPILGVWNITEQCIGNDPPKTVPEEETTLQSIELIIDFDQIESHLPLTEIITIATTGGVLLIVSIALAIAVMTHIKRKTWVPIFIECAD